MLTKQMTLGMAVCLLAGCTSFRTTSLYRFNNDSVVPECNKLKGLPVKLKVPSHARVVVYEQQVLLANSPDEADIKKKAATEAAGKVKALQGQIISLQTEVDDAEQEGRDGTAELKQREEQLIKAEMLPDTNDALRLTKVNAVKLAQELITAANKRIAAATIRTTKAVESRDANIADLQDKLDIAKRDADIAADDAVVGYTLVSFSPAQLVVETELEYTDKIFLVDFRRPAGGILDLKEASMDDEQYFAKIQAEVTERTMADVSTAIKTLQGPLTPQKSTDNTATPTSADTPDAEQAFDVNFQKSVVAFKRFDISEPGWEEQMMSFVNERLCRGAGPQLHESSGYSEVSDEYGISPSAELQMSLLPGNPPMVPQDIR